MSDSLFDIIIVGGGTAGCVLASRLSAISPLRILLLEAGANRNDDPKVWTPLTSRSMFEDPKYDWCFKTEPQRSLNNRVIQQTRGRMLGGSSAINSHSLVYPNKDMHDTWAQIIGDEKWCWDQIKDCYTQFCDDAKQSVSMVNSLDSARNEWSKPIKASYPRQVNELQQAWEGVFTELGMRSRNDGVSGDCFGGFTTTNAVDNRPGKGERSHAGDAYLKPTLNRANLVVETNAQAARVLFRKNPSGNSATLTVSGVEYLKEGQKLLALARREVIISAGAFGSPHLLELSGIGGSTVLNKADIECLLDLPGVGENLQDHLNFGPSVEVRSDVETLDVLRDPTTMAKYQKQYIEDRTGPLAEGAAHSFAFWPLQLFNTSSEEVELKSLLNKHSSSDQNRSRSQHEQFIKRMILSPDEASATVFMTRIQRYTQPGKPANGKYMTVVAMLSHPFSSGSSHVKTADAEAHPQIDLNYLSHPLDAEILSRHCIQIESLLEQPVYRNIIKPHGNRLPHDFKAPFRTLEDAKSAIRQYGATNYHPCGTCAMLPVADGGVVDGDLRVYGTSNLRVCDASIFPIIPRGNILTTVYAVAEKLAEMLLKEYSC